MSSLTWKINRVKAMSLAEIIFRACRIIQQKWEKRRLLGGWKPRPASKVVSSEPLFLQTIDQILEDWHRSFGRFDYSAYEKALNKANLFSLFDVDISGHVNWHLDPDSGTIAPLLYGKEIDYRDNKLVGNCKTLWELSRHKHLIPLAVAYAVTGDARFSDKIAEQVSDWITQNPYGIGVNWCSSLEVSLRLIAWCFTHSLLLLRHDKGLFDIVNSDEELSESIFQHAYFIRYFLSRHSSANNHLIGELTGLWIGSKVFNLGQDGMRWADFAKDELEQEASKQVFADGVSKEQATYYHLWVNEYLLLAWLVGNRYKDSFSQEFITRISNMSQFLADLRPSGGHVPQIGDSDDGVVIGFDPRNCADPYEELLSAVNTISSASLESMSSMSQKAFWYGMLANSNEYRDSNGLSVVEFDPPYKIYPYGGYVIFGDESVHAVFDAGSLGYPSIAAHGHADAMNLCLAINGTWWLVDPGTYCYHTEPEWRNYFRGTRAHNTVSINYADQSQVGGAFLWLQHASVTLTNVQNDRNGDLLISGSVQGYQSKKKIHRREIRFNRNMRKLFIRDFIDASDKDTFEVSFHFLPGTNVRKISESSFEADNNKQQGKLLFNVSNKIQWKTVKGQTDPIHGWYSDELGKKVPTTVLVGRGECKRVKVSLVEIDWSGMVP